MSGANKYQKVLLINPPGKCYLRKDGTLGERKHCVPQLGLAYLAGNLLENGYDVEVLDILAEGYTHEIFLDPFIIYGLPLEESVARIKKAAPHVVGISIMFSNRVQESYDLVAAVRKELPEAKIVLGGQHASAMPEDVIRRSGADFVLVGEADLSIVALVDALNERASLMDVQGLYFRDGDEIHNTVSGAKPIVIGKTWNYFTKKDAPIPKDLNKVPFPAWHLFPMSAYWTSEVRVGGGDIMRERFAVMVSTRGCPHTCYFCTSPLMGGYKAYRQRTNEDTIKEIKWLRDEYQVDEIMFLDDNFFVSAPRVKKLAVLLAQEFPDMVFSVPAGTEVNALDEEMIDLLAAANFHKITLAVESGNQEIQNELIDKRVKLDRLQGLVDYIKSKGIITHSLFMIGFPGETRAQIMRTVELALSIDVDDFYISIVTPLPGTPLYDMCVKDNLFYEDFDVNNIRYSVANIKLPDMNREELEALRRTVWLRFQEKQKTKKLAQEGSSKIHRKFTKVADYEFAGLSKSRDLLSTK